MEPWLRQTTVKDEHWEGSSQRHRFFVSIFLQGWWYAFFFSKTLQFVCATHQRVVLDQTVMLHRTVQQVSMELRVPAQRVKVVEVASSCRIESRRAEGEGDGSQFFVRAVL